MKKIIILLVGIIAVLMMSCKPTSYHWDSKSQLYINKVGDSVKWYPPNKVY